MTWLQGNVSFWQNGNYNAIETEGKEKRGGGGGERGTAARNVAAARRVGGSLAAAARRWWLCNSNTPTVQAVKLFSQPPRRTHRVSRRTRMHRARSAACVRFVRACTAVRGADVIQRRQQERALASHTQPFTAPFASFLAAQYASLQS
jgi:hypothetical protein